MRVCAFCLCGAVGSLSEKGTCVVCYAAPCCVLSSHTVPPPSPNTHPFPPQKQIRSLRTKLKDSRSAVAQLTTELSATKISMHEREAELATGLLRSSLERPLSTTLGRSVCLAGVASCVSSVASSVCLDSVRLYVCSVLAIEGWGWVQCGYVQRLLSGLSA